MKKSHHPGGTGEFVSMQPPTWYLSAGFDAKSIFDY